MGIREHRNRRAEDYLRSLIADLNPGEALPPLRRMMEESGLGRNVLENAARKLKAGRVLDIRARSGIYLTENRECAGSGVIDIVACAEIHYAEYAGTGTFASELLNAILAGAAARSLVPRLSRMAWDLPVGAYEALIGRHQIRNALLLMPHHSDLKRVFDAAGAASVAVLPRYYPNSGPAVIDAPELVPMQLEHLIGHGHRRIGFIHTVDLGFAGITDLLRRESFYRVMAEHGLPVRPEWVIHYSLDKERLFARLDGLFAGPESPTALAVSDWFLRDVYEYLRRRGRRIGADISLVSSDGLKMPELDPTPSSVVNSPEKTAELAWSLFDRLKNEPELDSIDCIGLGFRAGASVARLENSTADQSAAKGQVL